MNVPFLALRLRLVTIDWESYSNAAAQAKERTSQSRIWRRSDPLRLNRFWARKCVQTGCRLRVRMVFCWTEFRQTISVQTNIRGFVAFCSIQDMFRLSARKLRNLEYSSAPISFGEIPSRS